jgi:hypothetical protein
MPENTPISPEHLDRLRELLNEDPDLLLKYAYMRSRVYRKPFPAAPNTYNSRVRCPVCKGKSGPFTAHCKRCNGSGSIPTATLTMEDYHKDNNIVTARLSKQITDEEISNHVKVNIWGYDADVVLSSWDKQELNDILSACRWIEEKLKSPK